MHYLSNWTNCYAHTIALSIREFCFSQQKYFLEDMHAKILSVHLFFTKYSWGDADMHKVFFGW